MQVGVPRPIVALGAGGMGEVTLAVLKGGFDVKKLVVLKSLRRELYSDQNVRQMFLEEARLSARLTHMNVVHVHKVISGDHPAIVMEYLDGQPMSAVIRAAGERFTTAMQLRVISEALAGLHYSHELRDYDGTPLRIVHRDVSPQNVFITYEGQVKVVDFGLAKIASQRSLTKSGTIKGKLEYMPPEQMMGGSVDRRADIYAVGCMLWQACTGELLWANKSEALIVRHMMTGDIPAPSTRRKVHPQLEAMTLKALAFEPADRYQTALDLQIAVDEFLLQQFEGGPSSREIGAFVAELFAVQRRQRAEAIRAAMSLPGTLPTPAEGADNTIAAVSVPARTRSAIRSLGLAGVVTTLVAFGGAGISLLVKTRPKETGQVDNVTAEAHRSVSLRISVVPREAVVSVDNWPTHENPVLLRLPQDHLDHEVRAVLSGYESITRFVRLDSDLSLDLVLRKASPEVESKTHVDVGVAPPTRQSSPPANREALRSAPTANGACNPPYYFKDGVKLFRPECL